MAQNLERQLELPGMEETVETRVETPKKSKLKKGLLIGLWGAAITATALIVGGAGYGVYLIGEGAKNSIGTYTNIFP